MDPQPLQTNRGGARSRRKTLSPSRALSFLSSTLVHEEDGGAATHHRKEAGAENLPPSASSSRSNSSDPILWSTKITERRRTINAKSLKPVDKKRSKKAAICFHSPVFVTSAKAGGGREGGELWMLPSIEQQSGSLPSAFWWAFSPSEGSTGGEGLADITNHPNPSQDDDEEEDSWLMDEDEHHHSNGKIEFEEGKVVRASFVWLEERTPGLIVVMLGEGDEVVLFLEFRGEEAEEAARKALVILQARLRPAFQGKRHEKAAAVDEVTSSSSLAVSTTSMEQEREIAKRKMMREVEEMTDIHELVRCFQRAKPHWKITKAVAQRVYRLSGYSLMPMGTINAAVAGVEPTPVEPRRVRLTNEEMRAIVMKLEPIVRDMNHVHQREVKQSEEKTQARPERRKEDGCYTYWCLRTNVQISPNAYRVRYMATLPNHQTVHTSNTSVTTTSSSSLSPSSSPPPAAIVPAMAPSTPGQEPPPTSSSKVSPPSPATPQSVSSSFAAREEGEKSGGEKAMTTPPAPSSSPESSLIDPDAPFDDAITIAKINTAEGEEEKQKATDAGVVVHSDFFLLSEPEQATQGSSSCPPSPSPEDVAALFVEEEEEERKAALLAAEEIHHGNRSLDLAAAAKPEEKASSSTTPVKEGDEEKEEEGVIAAVRSPSAEAGFEAGLEQYSTPTSTPTAVDAESKAEKEHAVGMVDKTLMAEEAGETKKTVMMAIEGVDPQEVEMICQTAEVKLQFAIDQALRQYHHDVAVAHAALAANHRNSMAVSLSRGGMVLHFEWGSTTESLSDAGIRDAVRSVFDKLGQKSKVLVVPPDFTRFNSKAGLITQYTYEYYDKNLTDILPALGTHDPVAGHQRERMFGHIPADLFRVHDWRNDVVTIGHVPAELVREASDGQLDEPWPAQLNKLMVEGGHDLILSIGQVVPHEVLGMANYNKNLFIGIGGSEAINLSHFIGAVYGMERMMGVADNPLRRVLNHASEQFLAEKFPLLYILTVIGPEGEGEARRLVTRGLYIGEDAECFFKAAELSIQVVALLDEEEFLSTWLGNKSIYRTRMAIKDGGDLIVLAPGVKKFGEDERIDELIRKYGYRTTPELMDLLKKNAELKENLSAVAHLIHGSSEGRFRVTYCTNPSAGGLTKEEVEGVGYQFMDYNDAIKLYNPDKLVNGVNHLENGEEVYYIQAPALGLWAAKARFIRAEKESAEAVTAVEAAAEEVAALSSEGAAAGGGASASSPRREPPSKRTKSVDGDVEG